MPNRRSVLPSALLASALLASALFAASCATSTPPPAERAGQTIDFAAPGARSTTDPPFEIVATASSGLVVAFGATGVCTVATGAPPGAVRTDAVASAAWVTLSGDPGACALRASQAGDDAWRPADDVRRTVVVTAPSDDPPGDDPPSEEPPGEEPPGEEPPGDDPPTVDPEVRTVGWLLLQETVTPATWSVGGNGSFRTLDAPLPDDSTPFAVELDRCTIAVHGSTDAAPDPIDEPVALLDAGTPLAVRAGGAPYLDLERGDDGRYGVAEEAAPGTPLPDDGLSVAIPGSAAFPAFAAAPFAPAKRIAFDGAFDAHDVRPDTTFAWNGSGRSDTAVLLIGGNDTVAFSCVATDDGAFTFDTDARTELAAAGYEHGELRAAGRLAVARTDHDDVAVLAGTLRIVTFDATDVAVLGRDPRPAPAPDDVPSAASLARLASLVLGLDPATTGE